MASSFPLLCQLCSFGGNCWQCCVDKDSELSPQGEGLRWVSDVCHWHREAGRVPCHVQSWHFWAHLLFKKKRSPHRCGSVDRALACRLKGPGFNSGQGHVPWLRAHPQCGVCRRQLMDVSLSSMFLTLYPSPSLSVKNQ
uniref:Uncharacterized protein n=1 Tax=Pipistrellus kuhlii TaxID=59472 RepID=A0A7J7VUR6_PIPKU|nr:hypothetical protein mPipKuh1_008286 [Pipistrellus kuhlii]